MSSPTTALFEKNKDSFMKLIRFSAAMFVCGLGSFFLIRSEQFGGVFVESPKTRENVAAGVAVLVTNLVIATYVFSAFNEVDDSTAAPSISEMRDEVVSNVSSVRRRRNRDD